MTSQYFVPSSLSDGCWLKCIKCGSFLENEEKLHRHIVITHVTKMEPLPKMTIKRCWVALEPLKMDTMEDRQRTIERLNFKDVNSENPNVSLCDNHESSVTEGPQQLNHRYSLRKRYSSTLKSENPKVSLYDNHESSGTEGSQLNHRYSLRRRDSFKLKSEVKMEDGKDEVKHDQRPKSKKKSKGMGKRQKSDKDCMPNTRKVSYKETGSRPFKYSLNVRTRPYEFSIEFKKKSKKKSTKSSPRRFPCSQCSSKFMSKKHLNIHKLIHNGKRPFKCDLCPKAFNQITNLNNHKRIHTNEKPFMCHWCKKCFRQVTNLVFHERIHKGEMPYECKVCGRKFAQVANWGTHMKKYHP